MRAEVASGAPRFFRSDAAENSLAGATTADVIFRFRDEQGLVHMVQSLDDVPAAYKNQVERLELSAPRPATSKTTATDASQELTLDHAMDSASKLTGKAEALGDQMAPAVKKQAKEFRREVGDVLPFVNDLHWPSVAVGAAVPVMLLVIYSILRRRLGRALKLGLTVAAVALLGSGYLGWLQSSTTGQGKGLTTPGAIIKEAKSARNKLLKKQREQQRVLQELERTSQ